MLLLLPGGGVYVGRARGVCAAGLLVGSMRLSSCVATCSSSRLSAQMRGSTQESLDSAKASSQSELDRIKDKFNEGYEEARGGEAKGNA